ncbi:MAG: hypothetical protein Q4A12_00100 [Eubacteriales bacterium]|nr:hypothetical protein [Eubacteriales bacterium]
MELKTRKPTRLKGYDYSSTGVYFITLCSKDRKPVFSRVVGDGVLDIPKIMLSEYGAIIDKHLNATSNHYDYLSIDNYVIMPNHIHILISVYNNGMSRTPSPTNDIIPSFVSTLKRFVNREVGENVFQRSYIDHIIRDEKDFVEHFRYIENNPYKWECDELFV